MNKPECFCAKEVDFLNKVNTYCNKKFFLIQ